MSNVTSHTAPLSGLSANTLYNFRVKSKDAAGNQAVCSTAYAQAPHAAELNVVGDFTVEAWFKDEELGGYSHYPTSIVVKGDVASDRDIPFGIGIASNSLFVVEKGNNKFAYMYYDLARNRVSANSWHHVAATVKGSTKQVTLYLDGVQVQQGTFSVITSVGNNQPVSIGRNGGPSGSGNWKGKVDDVRIWNRVRTAQEIAANYRTQFTSAQSGLVANWRADEGAGTTAVDFGGTAQNASLQSGATWSSDVHP
jgi:hypothetical protein